MNNSFKMLTEKKKERKDHQPEFFVEIFFKNEGELKIFTERRKLKKSVATGPAL